MKELLNYILDEAEKGNDKIKISLRDELIVNIGVNLEVLVLELSKGIFESKINGKTTTVPLAKIVVVGNGILMIYLRNELMINLRHTSYLYNSIVNEV